MVNDPNDPNLPPKDASEPTENRTIPPQMESDNSILDALDNEEEAESEILSSHRGASVAIGSGKTIISATIFLGAMVFLGFLFFSGDDKPIAKPNAGESPSNPLEAGGSIAPAGSRSADMNLPPPPAINVSVPTVAPPPPPPPPPPPAPEPEPMVDESLSDGALPPPPPPPSLTKEEAPKVTPLKSFGGSDKERQQRLRANMMVTGGGGMSNRQKQDEFKMQSSNNSLQVLADQDPNVAYMQNVVKVTQSNKIAATRMTDLHVTIAQGKMVEAVLETAVNTDLPGLIRAVVSHDTYAEAGRNVLIPKGSRLIGNYNTGVFRGQKRVMVVWTRLIRPDGIDILIASGATDALGRAGVEGLVDNKYMESFSTAILTSLISLGVAYGADQATGNDSTTTRNTDGSSTTTGSSGAGAAEDAVSNIGNVAESIVRNNIDLRPTIILDQGSRINVFVQRDLVFDASAGNSGIFE